MVIADTHKAYERLTSAGFSKEKAEALLSMAGEGQDDLATKADLEKLEQVLRADLEKLEQVFRVDLEKLEQVLRADLGRLEQARKADKQESEAKMREMELRIKHDLMLRLGALVFAAAGLQVVVVGILLALFQSG